MRDHGEPAATALLTLPAHTPAPARVEVVPEPLPRRVLLTGATAVFFWGLAFLLVVLPPHYPYFLGALAFGIYFPHRYWTGRYRVRAFAGTCPRCERELKLAPGSRIGLPHTLTCFACHFEPRLEVTFHSPGAPEGPVAHRTPECAGEWTLRWLADERFLVCDGCRAHHPATAGAVRDAEEENERGALLKRLTAEGNILP